MTHKYLRIVTCYVTERETEKESIFYAKGVTLHKKNINEHNEHN